MDIFNGKKIRNFSLFHFEIVLTLTDNNIFVLMVHFIYEIHCVLNTYYVYSILYI